MQNSMSLQGPALKIKGELMLLIPLDAEGAKQVERSRGISEVEGQYLKIVIPEWIVGMLRIEEGDLVSVSNGGEVFDHAEVASSSVH